MRYNKPHFTFLVISVLLLFTTLLAYNLYVSLQRNKEQNKRCNQVIDSLRHHINEAEIFEGKNIGGVFVSNQYNPKIQLSALLSESLFSLIIVEPSSPCNSCLDEALAYWKKYFLSDKQLIKRVSVYIISEHNNCYTWQTAAKYGLEKNVFRVKESETNTNVLLSSSKTASFFVSNNATILYAEYIHITIMERFVLLLQKIKKLVV